MALTKISGNQINTATQAIVDTLSFLDGESVLRIPTGTTAQRPSSPSVGTIRFNSDNDNAEIYKADDGTGNPGWGSISGGGPSIGADSIIRTNPTTISENLTVGPTAGSEFANGMSAGPITIANGYTVTVESGGAWSVV